MGKRERQSSSMKSSDSTSTNERSAAAIPSKRRKKIEADNAPASPQTRELSPMKTRRGKPFGYGLHLPAQTQQLPKTHPAPSAPAPAPLLPAQSAPTTPPAQRRDRATPKSSPILPKHPLPKVPNREDQSRTASMRLLVDYAKWEKIKTINLKECSTMEELFDMLDKRMPWETRDAGNIVKALRITIPGSNSVLLHEEDDMEEFLRMLSSCGVDEDVELEARVVYDEDAW